MRLANSIPLLALLVVLSVSMKSSMAANITWKGDGAANNWNAAANWKGGILPGGADTAVFDPAVSNNSCNLNANVSISGLSILAGYNGVITQAANTITVGSSGWTQAGGTFNGGSGAITVNGSFTLASTFNAGSHTITVSGNWDSSGGTFAPEGSTVALSGTGTLKTKVDWKKNFFNLQCSAPGKTTTVLNLAVFTNVLTIGAGVLTGAEGVICSNSTNANSFVIDPNADMTGIHHLDIYGGSCNLPAHSKYPNLMYDAYNCTLTLLGDVTCGNLSIYSQGDGTGTVDLAGHNLTLRTTNSLTLGTGVSGAVLRNSSAAVSSVTIGGSVSIALGNNNTVFNATNTNVSVAGDWTNKAGASGLSAGNSTVTFNGADAQTITSGGAAFNTVAITNVSAAGVTFADQLRAATLTDTANGSKLNFSAASANAPHTVSGTLALSGGTGANAITLAPQSTATTWYLSPPPSTTVTGVNVSYSNSISAIQALASVNGGNNSNWVFCVSLRPKFLSVYGVK